MHELADVICDMLSRPLFAAEEVERERNVVLQELSMRLADPDGWIWDRLGTVAFGGDSADVVVCGGISCGHREGDA